jgi:hypothetical protein
MTMIDMYLEKIKKINIIGLFHLRSDLPKINDRFDKNFVCKWQCEGLIFGIYHAQNSLDDFSLKLIQPTQSNTFKMVSVCQLEALNSTDAINLSNALKKKDTTQGIFNFSFKVADIPFLLSIYINSAAQSYFITIQRRSI